MRVIRSSIVVSILLALAAGCATEEPARFDTSLEGTRTLGSLSDAEEMEFCAERWDYVAELYGSVDERIERGCTALALNSTQPGSCESHRDACLEEAASIDRCWFARFRADCELTVADYVRCEETYGPQWASATAGLSCGQEAEVPELPVPGECEGVFAALPDCLERPESATP